MDIADIANDYEDIRRQKLIDSRERYEGESATECEECGVEIPEARRIAVPGCKLCRDCAQIQEISWGTRRG